jgi:nitrite reductase/ring-hydroxylating ferredoxin subunit
MVSDPRLSADCASCALHDRRTFVARAMAALAAMMVLPGVTRAEELPAVSLARGVADTREIVRYPIPAADGVTIDADNEVILVRSRGQCMAFALSCPHQRAMLRQKGGDTAFQCPKHKSEYRLDGSFIRGRATRNMDRLAIQKSGTELLVDIDSQIQSDDEPAAWAAAVVSV